MNPRTMGAGALVVAALVAACGGGGGGSGGGGDGSGGTGLVPAAPTPGATVLADAAVLRPLSATRQWNYQGTEVRAAGASPVSYTTATTQTAVTATQATENFSNASNDGPESSTVQVSGGEVSTTEDADLTGSGVPGVVRTVELRSPVRVDDQYTSMDQRITASGLDVDLDGREDPVDLAIWARVAGRDPVRLADAAGTSVDAVRVNTTIVLRLVLASTGEVAGTVTGKLSTWYAEGTGIVRQSFKVEEDITGTVSTYDELLSDVAPLAASGARPQARPPARGVMPQMMERLRAAVARR